MNTVRINGQDYTSSLSDAEIAFMGNFSLPTTAQTLSGAIAEHENDISELNSNLNNLIKSTSPSLTFDSTGRSTINYRIDKILGIGVISADYTCTLRYLSDTQTLVYLRNKDTLALITSGVTATVRITYIS